MGGEQDWKKEAKEVVMECPRQGGHVVWYRLVAVGTVTAIKGI